MKNFIFEAVGSGKNQFYNIIFDRRDYGSLVQCGDGWRYMLPDDSEYNDLLDANDLRAIIYKLGELNA